MLLAQTTVPVGARDADLISLVALEFDAAGLDPSSDEEDSRPQLEADEEVGPASAEAEPLDADYPTEYGGTAEERSSGEASTSDSHLGAPGITQPCLYSTVQGCHVPTVCQAAIAEAKLLA